MYTAIQIFLKQTRRGTKRLVLQLVLLCIAIAFFVVSLNLYRNSTSNLQAVENAYTTLASVAFYGDVDRTGTLVSLGDAAYQGKHLTTVTQAQHDLSKLLTTDAVIGYDLRPRFAAYIPGQESVYYKIDEVVIDENHPTIGEHHIDERTMFSEHHLVRFTVPGDQPVQISLTPTQEDGKASPTETEITIQILSQARNIALPDLVRFSFSPSVLSNFLKNYGKDIQKLNQTEDLSALVLYPGKEYVMSFGSHSSYLKDPDTGVWKYANPYTGISHLASSAYMSVNLTDGYYDDAKSVFSYGKNGETISTQRKQECPIQLWDETQSEAWDKAFDTVTYSGQSFWVTLTNDMESIPAWYAGGMYLNEGRMITAEEYVSGARVCMVSARMAELQGWKVGDTLDLHLYGEQIYLNDIGIEPLYPTPTYRNNNHFFDHGAYEIVGIFGQREITDAGENLAEAYYQPWNTIYAPTNSVQNKPEESTWLIQPSTLTLKLKNGSISEFKAAVEELGLTEQKTGQYQLKFSYFDQGYDKIKPGLDEMHRNAKLLLGLSAALLAVTMILTAFLFAQQHKHSAGILRMLGGSKKQAFVAILACAAVVVAAGGIVGTVIGGVLTQTVGASTLGDAAEGAKVALSTGASPLLTVLSGIGCMALFLALTAIFTGTYIGKEPRQLLPQDKA